jgi:cyclopropane fatty-acyl-phospholipid synthase-like methyltransferase
VEWALDLGCGSGLNARYLAQHGYRVLGMDLALRPLASGQQAARSEGAAAYFCLADVTRPPVRTLQAAFALDIGCFHAVPVERRATYVASLAARLAAGAYYLLYAFAPSDGFTAGSAGVGPNDLALFAPAFVLVWARHGLDGARPSAWYLLRRTGRESVVR